MKSLENIKDKNEELLNVFSSKAPKNESNYNYDSEYGFYRFYSDFEKILKMSLASKYDDMHDFYPLLKRFINTHKAISIEKKDHKDRIIKNVKLFYNNYFDAYKKTMIKKM